VVSGYRGCAGVGVKGKAKVPHMRRFVLRDTGKDAYATLNATSCHVGWTNAERKVS
jgi:hypothetical protein